MRRSFPIARAYFPDYVLVLASAVVPPLVVATADGVVEFGHLRFALVFLGPVAIAWLATANVATPRLARAPDRRLPVAVSLSVAGVVAVVAWGGAVLLIPADVGSTIFGVAWVGARSWLPWVVLGQAALASFGGPVVGLRACGYARSVLRVRTITLPLMLASPCIGYLTAGRAGFGVGYLIGGSVAAVGFWRSLIKVREPLQVGVGHG
jgi:hypothetical protein